MNRFFRVSHYRLQGIASQNSTPGTRLGPSLEHRSQWFKMADETILGLNGYQHTISPWFVVLGIMAGIAHASTVLLIGWFGGEPMLLDH